MFTSIARRYDLLNHLLSLNLDRRWRQRAAHEAFDGRPRSRVLDLCAGTGDLALELARRFGDARIVALDFLEPMLERGRAKSRRAGMANRIYPVCGDALHLPFRDHSFEVLTVAFGLRNLFPIEKSLAEMARVIQPGGQIVILEFALPAQRFWRWLYGLYFFRILPKIGKWISGTSAYSYLAASVALFPQPERLCEMLGKRGFADVQWHPLTGGTVALYTARVAR